MLTYKVILVSKSFLIILGISGIAFLKGLSQKANHVFMIYFSSIWHYWFFAIAYRESMMDNCHIGGPLVFSNTPEVVLVAKNVAQVPKIVYTFGPTFLRSKLFKLTRERYCNPFSKSSTIGILLP